MLSLRKEMFERMRLIYLPTFWTIVIDFIVWFLIHLGVVSIMIRIRAKHFNLSGWLYKNRKWEKGGEIYQKIFKIKKWKKHLPDGARLLGKLGFPKKQLDGTSGEYFTVFLIETCRAESTHWLFIFFAPFFFLWNRPGVGAFMILYALVENIPFIMAQRYNRYRFRRLLDQKRRKS